MAEGIGNAPISGWTDPVFETGAASLYLPAFQKWSGWQELHLRPPRSEQGRLLLTLHPEIGCQSWTRTNIARLIRPACYFDTTWQWHCRQEPADNGLLFYSATRAKCREVLVTLQLVASGFVF